ncbi:Catechol 1,2-dioxygenase [Erysiphe neolycopersici]|uniref:Catechol 1,2-dioxygenase n=1 Tax=Erysiphe neolycopersici TaxID=212602 RepID=A0A420H7F2_9PEZI|nr:Catechol 1,2-dioxygenase [Erysiphe neolycopersici]
MNTTSKSESTFTQNVINAIGPRATPRIRQVMSSLIRHLHDFTRENEITSDEWIKAMDFINWAGKLSDENKNETLELTYVFGLESLLEDIALSKENQMNSGATASAILGPFYRHDAPVRENESFIFQNADEKEIIYVHGIVSDKNTKKPLAGAWIDVWQANSQGLYDHQVNNQDENNLRGKFKTDINGHYGFYSVQPGAYPLPCEGPTEDLLKLLDRPNYRPGHIHIIARHEGYKSLTTQIYNGKDQYIDKDVVCAVKDSLIVDFKPIEGNPIAKIEVEFPIILAPFKSTK